MREIIVLAPGCNGTELIRTLAKHGINSIGLRVMGAVELSNVALFKSGISIKADFLPRREEPALYDSFIRDIPYFATASYSDAENLASSLYTLRSLIAKDEEENILKNLPTGVFEEKNKAICEVYKAFLDETEKRGLIDSISLIRKAVAEANEINAEFYELKEYPLTVLEKELLRKASGKKAKEISLIDIFEIQEKQGAKKAALTKAYGASNEVENIIGYIYSNNIPIDKCVIAAVDTNKYSQLFYDYSQQYGINLTFGSGVPILNSNPARLLRVYTKWITNEFYGVNDLKAIVLDEAFEVKKLQLAIGVTSKSDLMNVIEIAGNLRLSRDKAENDRKISTLKKVYSSQLTDEDTSSRDINQIRKKQNYLDPVEALARELEKEYGDFIKAYSVIRKEHAGRIDTSALNIITDSLEAYFKYSDEGTINEAADMIFKKTVCSENSREGCLYVTSLAGAMASMREHLFVTGLSADVFPGSPTEDYLLLDSDYLLFANKPVAPTSDQLIRNRINTYRDLINLADALGAEVRLSYSSYDLSELKEKNPSSVITETVSGNAGFFDQEISLSRGIGRSYTAGKEICFSENIDEGIKTSIKTDGEYSPSSIEVFFKCPRKYMLIKILGLEEPDDEDPFCVIDAAQLGTLIHAMMGYLANKKITRSEFESKAEKCFDEFLMEYIPLHEDAAQKEKELFKKLVLSAFDNDPGNEVILAEERICAEHAESGIKLAGYPDRVERKKDDTCIITDFKTGRKIGHIENDIDTCIQVIIYAYIMEKNGISIDSGEYRYLRKLEKISCQYDKDMRQKLAEKLMQFKNALTSADFPCTDNEENCRYCKLISICGKDEEMLKDEEDGE